jgi:hypothetical protein
MKYNHELFKRDPRSANLANDGQARIMNDADNDNASKMLRYELENFVCEGQYAHGMQTVLEAFLSNLGASAQRAAWVSGFYGSGKSHLLKMLCHLWVDTAFDGGSTARSLAPDLTPDVLALLVELDTAGRKSGGGLFAVSGTMPEGSSESARLTVLGLIFRACGLPSAYNQALFCLYLKKEGFYEDVRKKVEAGGRNFERELNDLFVSRAIRSALLEADPGLGDEGEVRQLLREQFPNKKDIDSAEFVTRAKEVLTMQGNGVIPLTIIVLDEVQHYIQDEEERSKEITELAETINKQMDCKLLVVAAGQNALSTETPQFAWLKDRFTIPVELSDADVETVTRKVLLSKKPQAVAALDKTLDSHSGEIERHLNKTRIAPNTKDRDFLVPDYPILPTRRRFWELALRSMDPTGSSSLLRTQLRITHEALREVADEPIGHTIPGDFMYFQQRTPLVQQNVLPREISDRIIRLDDETPEGRLKARVCGLVFMIRKLSRESSVDSGVRATEDMLADMLVADLKVDGTRIRKDLPPVLKSLLDDGVLLYDGDEYNLQTKESAEWDDKFRTELAKARQDKASTMRERKSRFEADVEATLKNIRPQQGQSRTPRQIHVHFGVDAPDLTSADIPIWVRDGWECSDKDVLSAARKAGSDSPILFVHLSQIREDPLRENILRMKAAKAVIDLKGVPTTHEAEEARDAMKTRQNDAERTVKNIIQEILSTAKVYKGGGTELHALELADKIRDGADDALTRLFPNFTDGDHKAWGVAISRAKAGDDSPLKAVSWQGATADHPVCKEIEAHIGASKEGKHIRAHYEKPPYGWPRDAVDAALISLHAAGHLLATNSRTGETIAPRHLDQNKIPVTKFKTESVTLGTRDRIALKGLIQSGGISVKPDDDLSGKANEFLSHIIEISQSAGGAAPLPDRPSIQHIEDLRASSGNQQLADMLAQLSTLQQQQGDWKSLAQLAEKRSEQWQRLTTLLSLGKQIASFQPIQDAADAILKDRLLLDGTDHCSPLIKQAADILRAELTNSRKVYNDTRSAQLDRLDQNDTWKKLTIKQQEPLLEQTPLPEVDGASIATEQELLDVLRVTPLPHWQDRTDALSARVDSLISAAATLLTPKAKRVRLPSATINDTAELDQWLKDAKSAIGTQLKDGPVIL